MLDDRHRYDETNRLVHEFKILWVGNWPPDQNPTWEPEANLPRKLVEEYRKKQARKLGSKSQKTLSPYMLNRRFSSVAEAFEGELDDATNGIGSNYSAEAVEEVSSDENQAEKLIVTEESELELPVNGKKHSPAIPAFSGFGRRSFENQREAFGGEFRII